MSYSTYGVELLSLILISGFALPSLAQEQSVLKCESINSAYKTCSAGAVIKDARLMEQLSKASCTKNSSWGFQDKSIWVDKGCRATFSVTTAPVIICESIRSAYKTCPTGFAIRDAQLVEQLSKASCTENSSWGFTSQSIWVNKGCRATFSVVAAPAPSPSPTPKPSPSPTPSPSPSPTLPPDPGTCDALSDFDSIVDDASAVLQDCINRTPSGQTLRLPAGNFTLAKQIFVKRPMTITTRGAERVNCYTNERSCAKLTAAPEIHVPDGFIQVMADSVTWDHIVITGNKANRYDTQAAAECIAFENNYGVNAQFKGNNITISNSVFKNALCGSGLIIRSASNYNIHHNTIATNGAYSKNGKGECTGLCADGMTVFDPADSNISNNQFIDNTDINFIIGSCKNCKIQSNTFTHTDRIESASNAAMVFFNWGRVGSAGSDLTGADISGNVINCSSGHRCGFGIYVGANAWWRKKDTWPTTRINSTGGTFHDNKITGAQQGLAIDTAAGVWLYNNTVSNSGGTFSSTCGTKTFSAYDITPGTPAVKRTGDTTPTGDYDQFSLTSCIPTQR